MQTVRTTLLLLSVLLFTAHLTLAQDKPETETRVTMRDLPPAVQQTVREQRKGAVLLGLAKEVENGQTFYEAELKVNGHNKDVLIDPTGKIVEIEEQVTLDSLPAAVKTEIVRQAGKGRILLVESITKDNAIVAYEAHVRTGKRVSEIKIDPEGKPIPIGK